MALSLNAIHPYEIRNGKPVALAPRPALRLSIKDQPPIFIQGGKTYGDGGDQIARKDLPDWFWTELKKAKPKALAECGFVPEGKRSKAKETEEAAAA